jgi:hypothetical protein
MDTASHLTRLGENQVVSEPQISGINAFFAVAMAASYLIEFGPVVGL